MLTFMNEKKEIKLSIPIAWASSISPPHVNNKNTFLPTHGHFYSVQFKFTIKIQNFIYYNSNNNNNNLVPLGESAI